MKTFKFNYPKTITTISFAFLLVFASCKNSNNSSKENQAMQAASIASHETPKIDLPTAILTDNIEAVKQHLLAGTNLNKKDAMTGSTPLITAATFGKKKIVTLLLEAKPNLSITNNDGATALHTAAFFCEVEIVQMLIDAKADQSLKNNFGATPKQSVMGPFEQIKPIYEMLQKQLEPMGLKIDLNHIEKTRPVIANMLQ